MKKWTVILIFPDYMAEDFGSDIYVAWVEAISVQDAVPAAQKQAFHYTVEKDPQDPNDFAAIAIVEGFHAIFTPQYSFANLSPPSQLHRVIKKP